MAIEILENVWLEKGKTMFLLRNISPPPSLFPLEGEGRAEGITN
jgi:hypothetical protein